MASKYAKLRGQIPEVPTERDQAFTAALDEVCDVNRDLRGLGQGPAKVARKDKTLAELTAEYNAIEAEIAEKEAAIKPLKVKQDVVELLIRKKIEGDGADNVTMNGYTWTPKSEPYPGGVEDNVALIDHFITSGQKHMLSIHPSRLGAIIKEEAIANELTIEMKKVPGPNGTEIEVPEVRSGRLPGVKVYLKPALGRVKSSKGDK